jgi:hypothetical protein
MKAHTAMTKVMALELHVLSMDQRQLSSLSSSNQSSERQGLAVQARLNWMAQQFWPLLLFKPLT